MNLKQILHSVELFDGLTGAELDAVAAICQARRLAQGEVLTTQGQPGDELFIVTQGFVEVVVGESRFSPARVVVNLGAGQLIGEMALLDQGRRSATARALDEPTLVQAIHRADFERLCQDRANIGYVVMRNLALDLSFKLRHRNLSER